VEATVVYIRNVEREVVTIKATIGKGFAKSETDCGGT
jgi:hypothetical protein